VELVVDLEVCLRVGLEARHPVQRLAQAGEGLVGDRDGRHRGELRFEELAHLVQLAQQPVDVLLGEPLGEQRAQVVPLRLRADGDPPPLGDVDDVERGEDLERLAGHDPGDAELLGDVQLGGRAGLLDLPVDDPAGEVCGHLHRERPDLDTVRCLLSPRHVISLYDKWRLSLFQWGKHADR
jgi:hypothetical protein